MLNFCFLFIISFVNSDLYGWFAKIFLASAGDMVSFLNFKSFLISSLIFFSKSESPASAKAPADKAKS